ncbi:uncharacterized protein LOC119592115 [Penaeus monodon]|uniref:uncharacterized protein LOC119592115 n=1 Tax=Penaeus monodon TaxID=6687 RepID=UPI0018A6D431|nr:uncharacterized protein LOC119592115 [Penaeus monodon]
MVPRGAFLLLAVSAVWLSGCVHPAASEADTHGTCICVPKGSCSQPVSNATCDNDELICCSEDSAGRRSKRDSQVKPQRNKEEKETEGKERKLPRTAKNKRTNKAEQNEPTKKPVNQVGGHRKRKLGTQREVKPNDKTEEKKSESNGKNHETPKSGREPSRRTNKKFAKKSGQDIPTKGILTKESGREPSRRTNKKFAKKSGQDIPTKGILTKGSMECTKEYGTCKSKCRGDIDRERACPNGKVCCRKLRPRNQAIVKAKDNECTAAGGVCKRPNKECKEPLSFECPNKDRICCKSTTKNKCASKGFKCVKNCRGTTKKFKGCKEGSVCCKQAKERTCKQVGGNCKEEAKCKTEVLNPNKKCKDGKVCCKQGNKCQDLGATCREEAKCKGEILTPSIPCKKGNVCCEKGNKCKDLKGTCREEAKCNGEILTPSIPCKKIKSVVKREQLVNR